MDLKLSFTRTTDDIFRVHAIPLFDGRLKERRRDAFTVEYADEDVFLRLLEEVDLDPIQHAEIVGTIAALALCPNTPACCEDISVDESQLLILLNGAIRSRMGLNC